MANVYISNLTVPRRPRNKRIYSDYNGSNTIVNNSSTVVNNSQTETDTQIIINKDVVVSGTITADNLTPLIIPFANEQNPSLENYNDDYADTYGQYPIVKCFIIDGDIEYEAAEKAITEKSGGLISRVSFDLSDARNGYIYLLGNTASTTPVPGINAVPLILPFTNSAAPAIENYNTLYSVYGQYPTLRLYTVEGDIRSERMEPPKIELSGGLISRIAWDLPAEFSGFIYLLGNVHTQDPDTTEYSDQEAVGTTNIAGTGSEADMAGMSITFTPNGKRVLIMFSAAFYSTVTAQEFTVYINFQGTNVRKSTQAIYQQSLQVSMHHRIAVTPGEEITVKIRWNATANIHQYGSTKSERILTILDLP